MLWYMRHNSYALCRAFARSSYRSVRKMMGKRPIPRLTKETHCYEDTTLKSGPRGFPSGCIALGGSCVWCGVVCTRGWVSLVSGRSTYGKVLTVFPERERDESEDSWRA